MKKTVIDKRRCEDNEVLDEIDTLHKLGYGVEVSCSTKQGPFNFVTLCYVISVIKWEEDDKGQVIW